MLGFQYWFYNFVIFCKLMMYVCLNFLHWVLLANWTVIYLEYNRISFVESGLQICNFELQHIHNFLQRPQGSMAESFALPRLSTDTFEWWCTFFIHTLVLAQQHTHFDIVTVCTYRQLQSKRFSMFIPPCHSSIVLSVLMNIMNETTYFIHAGHIHIVTINFATVGFK